MNLIQVNLEDFQVALAVAESKKCKFFSQLTPREKEIVIFMDMLHPLPTEGECYEEVMDVCGAELWENQLTIETCGLETDGNHQPPIISP